ncbi:MAG: adenylate/guanylate cyclase domain-containing protein, partial [Cyanobacteria bacterium P01_A01_bin.135]
ILGAQLNAQWENQQLKSLLAIHLDPTAASLLWQQRDRILNQGELPAQEAIATVMFIDIRGFTAVAEALPPQRLMRWLNQYLDAITQEITNRGGTVDKFVGDEVMAYFRLPPAEADPTALSQQALLAIETGLAVHERIQQLNQQLQRAGRDTIAVGIGIHTGPVSIGSMGSRHRLNYSMVGDTVNVAARLEELNKVVVTGNPFSLLLSEATYRAIGPRPLGDRFSYAPVGTFQLRGRTQPVCVYTVLPTPVYPTAQPAIIS